jgi:hypothetical protein
MYEHYIQKSSEFYIKLLRRPLFPLAMLRSGAAWGNFEAKKD